MNHLGGMRFRDSAGKMRPLMYPNPGLGCRFSRIPCVQESIGRLLSDVSMTHSVSEKILNIDDFVNRLQDEMNKIDAFKHDLPYCKFFLTYAILAAEEECAKCDKLNSEPVLEEFLPLTKHCGDEKVEDSKEVVSDIEKQDWMSSVQLQLWNPEDENSSNNILSSKTDAKKKKKKEDEMNLSLKHDLFKSFERCPSFAVMEVGKGGMDALPAPGLSLCTPGTKNSGEAIDNVGPSYSRSGSSPAIPANFKAGHLQAGRKQRRCWSAELHRQFINALQHLGGPQAATPKQIREHMQVDGLTNDEVKSHLQKYRLHIRKVSTNTTSQPAGLCTIQDKFGESLKQSKSQCGGSPLGPLHLCRLEGEGLTHETEDD